MLRILLEIVKEVLIFRYACKKGMSFEDDPEMQEVVYECNSGAGGTR